MPPKVAAGDVRYVAYRPNKGSKKKIEGKVLAGNVRVIGRPIAGERIAIGAVVVLMVINGFAGSQNTQSLQMHTNLVKESYILLNKLDNLESALQSAESGQRGFLLTGQDSYLDSFHSARKYVDSFLNDLSAPGNSDSTKRSKVVALMPIVERMMVELATSIDVRRSDGFEAAHKLVHGPPSLLLKCSAIEG